MIEGSQEAKSPSAPGAFLRMIRLLRNLDASAGLKLHVASHFFKLPSQGATGSAATTTRSEDNPRPVKQHGELTPVAQNTRVQLREAIFSRFGTRRWGDKFREESHLFDMVTALNPAARKLGYIDRLASSAGAGEEVKKRHRVKSRIWRRGSLTAVAPLIP